MHRFAITARLSSQKWCAHVHQSIYSQWRTLRTFTSGRAKYDIFFARPRNWTTDRWCGFIARVINFTRSRLSLICWWWSVLALCIVRNLLANTNVARENDLWKFYSNLSIVLLRCGFRTWTGWHFRPFLVENESNKYLWLSMASFCRLFWEEIRRTELYASRKTFQKRI